MDSGLVNSKIVGQMRHSPAPPMGIHSVHFQKVIYYRNNVSVHVIKTSFHEDPPPREQRVNSQQRMGTQNNFRGSNSMPSSTPVNTMRGGMGGGGMGRGGAMSGGIPGAGLGMGGMNMMGMMAGMANQFGGMPFARGGGIVPQGPRGGMMGGFNGGRGGMMNGMGGRFIHFSPHHALLNNHSV